MTDKAAYLMSEAIREAYKRGEDDEDMQPLVRFDKNGRPVGRIGDGDAVIFYDIRGEREIQLSEAFTDPNFAHFEAETNLRPYWATMIEYDRKLRAAVAFPPLEKIHDTLSEIVSRHGMSQTKISESEKAVHISFFFNGKNKEPFPGERRIEIPSRKDVANYDDCPEMSAAEVAEALIAQIERDESPLIVGNFANIDVLGHIENREAILHAVRTVDAQVQRVVEVARTQKTTTVITSDHGTVEKWLYPEGTIDTGHTDSPVHCIIVQPDDVEPCALRPRGTLCDVAPTILELLKLDKPAAMTGTSLLDGDAAQRRQKVLLLITDGWGFNEDSYGNLIHIADTKHMDRLMRQYPHALLEASGEAVGLPGTTVGNSEAGHLHLGAGRVIFSDRVRIEKAIEDGSFFENEAFLGAMRAAKKNGKNLHLLGIISFFSSHGSIEHLKELMRMAKKNGVSNVFIHGLLGRRGERPESGARYTREIEEEAQRLGVGGVASIIGRYWALDREENWDRIEKTYRMLVYGTGTPVGCT